LTISGKICDDNKNKYRLKKTNTTRKFVAQGTASIHTQETGTLRSLLEVIQIIYGRLMAKNDSGIFSSLT